MLLARALFLLLLPSAQTPAPAPDLTARLRADDEILLKAVHTADRAAWQRLAAPDFAYVDEEGGVTPLAVFLKELEPMSTKPLEIESYTLTRSGDTASVIHRDTDDEHTRYLFTETWQRLDGEWRLRILHISNILGDPPAIVLTHAQIDELAGTYRSGSTTLTIRRDGDRIFAQRADGPEQEQKAETRDILFTPGSPRIRRVFERDSSGKVTGFVRRYSTSDVLWTRVN